MKLNEVLKPAGWIGPVYHGTNNDFTEFETHKGIGSHFGTKQQAKKMGKVKTYYLNIKNPLDMPDMIGWPPFYIVSFLKKQDLVTDNFYEKVISLSPFPDLGGKGGANMNKDAYDLLRKKIQSLGYDAIRYENDFEGEGISYIVFEPDQIKMASE